MRFDYPVLVFINTNVINGHKKQVDSGRLIHREAVLRRSPWHWLLPAEAPGAVRGAGPLPVPTQALLLLLLLLPEPPGLPSGTLPP